MSTSAVAGLRPTQLAYHSGGKAALIRAVKKSRNNQRLMMQLCLRMKDFDSAEIYLKLYLRFGTLLQELYTRDLR
jgi:hypothetical protein